MFRNIPFKKKTYVSISRCWHHDKHRSKKNSLRRSYWISPVSLNYSFNYYWNSVAATCFSPSWVSSSSSLIPSSCFISDSWLSPVALIYSFLPLSKFGYNWPFPSDYFSIYSLSISIFQSSIALSYALAKSKSKMRLFWILTFKSRYYCLFNLE